MKKNLFKKVAAFVTAASMVASLGTVAFADNYYKSGIKITNVTYDKTVVNGEVVPGEYDVTVEYLVDENVKNKIGVTMLAYTGENLSVDKDEYTEYNNSMQIVGIDQQEQKAQTGSFEFRVAASDAGAINDDDAIKVAYGVPSIILVSGDKVAPAAATLLIEKQKQKITADSANYTYEGDTIQYYSYEKADLKDNVKAALADMSDTATLKDADGKVIGTVLISDVNIISAVKNDNADTCKVTATIPADTTVTSESYDVEIPDGLNVEFDVTVQKIKWAVTSTSYGSDNKMTISSQGSLVAVKSAVEAKLAKDGVTVANTGLNESATKKIYSVTVDIPDDVEYESESADDQTVICNVTADITDDPDVMVDEGEEAVLTFELTVTISDTPAIPEVVYGDITGATDENGKEIGDGEVAMDDVNKAFQCAMGNIELEDWQKTAANVATAPADEEIAMDDVNSIFQYAMGNISKFPVEGE